MVLSISFLVPKTTFRDQEIKNFTVEINQKFNVLKEQALVNDDYFLIFFDRDIQEITVKNLLTQKTNTCMKLPKFLTLVKNSEVRIYGEKGIAPISIFFKDQTNNNLYRLTLQMGWGTVTFVKV
ncbi:hypothetical protein XA3_10010 [Xylocopilactobacillus apicola]|uniref:Uncharacterized protein n=2 Tax=Xylocopilactobacillus apicola TaxID=2932184 RepID=A0AAU9DF61_9LACO|nr:hypothetical protein XA3_09790 [Xylocopilactobacillus apicola]BDR58560.1 hypothetical protein XA3_10010 [Xylocopilactobacillus apicola]